MCVKLIYFIKTNMIASFFSKFSVTFLRINIKYAVSSAVSGALLGTLKVAILRTVTIQGAFADDYFK